MAVIVAGLPDTDEERRRQLYSGAIQYAEATDASRAFVDHAWDLIREAFDPIAPQTAQDELPVEKFVEIVAALKPRFTHSPTAKTLLANLIAAYGCDTELTYFDLPKLRIVSHSGYLTAGVGYAYKEHRDVWYSCPPCQNNWWIPMSQITPDSALAFFPRYWEKPARNSSSDFDAFDWNAKGRASAATHVKSDNRNHPTVADKLDLGDDLRVIGGPASVLIFSAGQLHATVPNTSGRTRFSIDFRTAHIDDLRARAGAKLVDAASTGTTIYDFARASDLAPVPQDVVSLYDADAGKDVDRVLIFEPEKA